MICRSLCFQRLEFHELEMESSSPWLLPKDIFVTCMGECWTQSRPYLPSPPRCGEGPLQLCGRASALHTEGPGFSPAASLDRAWREPCLEILEELLPVSVGIPGFDELVA